MTHVNPRCVLLALALAGLALNGCDPGEGPNPGTDAGVDAGTDGGDDQPLTEPSGAEASQQIQAVRDVVDEDADVAPPLPVEGVAVTYVRPQLGEDPAGFFVQAEMEGPALFVAVDPATLTPAPEVGDLVSFQVDATTVVAGQHRVTGIQEFTLRGGGYDVMELAQDVSGATDLVSGLDGFESELLVLDGTVEGALEACGEPSVCGAITTDGIPAVDEGLRLRLPEELMTTSGLRSGCTVSVGPTPLWRFEAIAQASAWKAEDLEVVSCPGLRVQSAIAKGPTTITLRFTGELAAETVNAAAFTITGPSGALTVLDATVAGDTVTLSTSAHEADAVYSVHIAQSITDVDGLAVEADTVVEVDAFRAAAGILVNEAELDAADGCDRIELRVVTSGPMGGVALRDRTSTPLFVFPEGFFVQKNDLIVVHMGRSAAACNGGVVPADELDGPTSVDHPANLPGAHDFWAEHVNVEAVNNVLFLLDGEGGYLDFVPFHTPGQGSIGGLQVNAMDSAAEADAWNPPLSGGFYNTGNYRPSAVEYLPDASAGTLQRTTDGDTNTKTGWGQASASLGALNDGQVVIP